MWLYMAFIPFNINAYISKVLTQLLNTIVDKENLIKKFVFQCIIQSETIT